MLQADFFQRDQIVCQSTFSFEHSGIGTLKLTQCDVNTQLFKQETTEVLHRP